MKERLIQLLEKERITSAEFADRIGVQRSNVSHILNGRNNPGFSFIQKVLESFPRVDSRWLITGEGSIDSSTQNTSKFIEKDLFTSMGSTKNELVNGNIDEKSPKKEQANAIVDNQTQSRRLKYESTSKNIVRVLLFYNDNTFEDFSPTDKM